MKFQNSKKLRASANCTYFFNLEKNSTGKQYSLLVNDITLASDNLLRFRRNLFKRILKLIMAIDDRIRDENMQYDINREVGKISSSK